MTRPAVGRTINVGRGSPALLDELDLLVHEIRDPVYRLDAGDAGR